MCCCETELFLESLLLKLQSSIKGVNFMLFLWCFLSLAYQQNHALDHMKSVV